MAARIKAEFLRYKEHYIALASVIAIGIGLRIYWLFQSAAENDEIYSFIRYAAKPLSYTLTNYDTNNHPLNTLLNHFTTRLLGSDLWAIRIWVLLCGIAVLPLIYVVIRKLYSKEAALLGTGLTACSLALVKYSNLARGYMIQTCIFLILILVSIRIKEKGKGWFWYVFLTGVGFYAVITFLYFFGIVFLWLLYSGIFEDTKESRKPFLIKHIFYSALACLFTLLLYTPYFLGSGLSSIIGNPFVKSLAVSPFLKAVPTILSGIYESVSGDMWIVIMPVMLLGFALSIIYNKRMSRAKVSFPLVALIWMLVMLFGQRAVVYARVLVPFMPVFFGCAAAGIYFAGHSTAEWLAEKKKIKGKSYLYPLTVVAVAVLLVVMVYPAQIGTYWTGQGEYTGLDYEVIAELLKDRVGENDVVYGDFFMVNPLTYYFEKKDIPLTHLYKNTRNVRTISPDEVENAFIVTDIGYNTLSDVLVYTGLEYNGNYEIIEQLHAELITDKLCLFEIVVVDTGNAK